MRTRKSGYAAVVLGIVIALTQFADMAIHVATDQAEAIRLVSNGLILLGLALTAILRKPRYRPFLMVGAAGIYLMLNLIFVVQHGLTNPEEGGQPRTALILLVILTLILSALFAALMRNRARA